MGLAAPYTGEGELDIVMDTMEQVDADISDIQAVVLGLLSAVVEAIFRAQTSGNARDRNIVEELRDANGDRRAPVLSALITKIASEAHILRNELLALNNAPTAAQLLATDGEAHDFLTLNPVH